MIEILKLGENTWHDDTFVVDRPQGHPLYLLLLTRKPAMFFIDENWIEVPEHTAFLFLPGQRHLYHALKNAGSEPAYADDWAHISSPLTFLPEHFPYGKPVFLHQPEDYFSLFHLIHNEFFGATPGKDKILDELMTALLLKINAEADTREYPAVYYDLVALRKEIYAHPNHEWKVSDMADVLHISTGYLHVCYRQFFHTTCIHDVMKSRIEYACDLLSSSHRSVEEIAALSGYHHTEHFIRQFKAEMHMTPLQYRKKERN